MTEPSEPPKQPACAKCSRGIEWCSFCDEPECQVSVCYRCLAVDLKLAMVQPHTHGG